MVDSRWEDLRAMGVPEAQIRELIDEAGEAPGDVFKVLPCNWPAVKVFLALDTQWRVRWDGQLIGLVYEAVPAVLDLMGVKRKARREVFRQVRVIERAALGL